MADNENHDGTASKAADPKALTSDGGTGFRPVTGAEEMQSGGRLLVEAYAAIWLIVLGLVFLMWRRTRALEERMAVLDGAVSRAEAAARKSKTESTEAMGSAKRTSKKKVEPAEDAEPKAVPVAKTSESGD